MPMPSEPTPGLLDAASAAIEESLAVIAAYRAVLEPIACLDPDAWSDDERRDLLRTIVGAASAAVERGKEIIEGGEAMKRIDALGER